jgi:hypothetical protein
MSYANDQQTKSYFDIMWTPWRNKPNGAIARRSKQYVAFSIRHFGGGAVGEVNRVGSSPFNPEPHISCDLTELPTGSDRILSSAPAVYCRLRQAFGWCYRG